MAKGNEVEPGTPFRINERTELSIPLRNLIALIVITAGFVGQYFIMDSRLDQLEKDRDNIMVSQKELDEFQAKVNPLISEASVRFEYVEKAIAEIKELIKSNN